MLIYKYIHCPCIDGDTVIDDDEKETNYEAINK